MNDALVVGCILFAAIAGFIFGTAYERNASVEWVRASACPDGTWKYSECVPTGCHWLINEMRWDCGGKAP